MCIDKDVKRTKVDRLILAMERVAGALERAEKREQANLQMELARAAMREAMDNAKAVAFDKDQY